jgi:hypothetical protein
MAVVASAAVLIAGCGSDPPARVFTGETDQHFPVRIRMSGDGDRLTFRIVWACPVLAGLAPVTTALRGMPVSVTAVDTFSEEVDYTYALSDSTRARVRGSMAGRVDGGRITGSFHPELTTLGPGTARCDPGAIAFSAGS